MIVGELLGWWALRQVDFGDLGGSASRAEQQMQTLAAYATRALLIVDREGEMAEYLEAAFERGTVSREDALLFDDNLEASNAAPDELVKVEHC